MSSSPVFRFQFADNQNAFPGRIHYHDTWEIYRLTEGSCRYFIDNKTYRLETGDLVVIPPGVIHNVIYSSDIHSRMLINCSDHCIPPACIQYLKQTVLFSPDPQCARLVESLYTHIQTEAQQKDEFFLNVTSALTMQLLVQLCRHRSSPRVSASSPFVEDALVYIHENFSSHLSLTETAQRCAVSPEHLSRIFRKETGFGFNEYIGIYRLKRAESILKSGCNSSIAQVAAACGFPDSNYFSKAYRRMYGISPSKVKPDTP